MSVTSTQIFEGVNALAQLVMAGAIATGVWVAYSQLKTNREDALRRRRAELAEEMLVVAAQVEDAFRHMRNPIDQIPVEHLQDKEFAYRKRYDRLNESTKLFQKMRETQIRCEAVMPGASIKPHVTNLNNARIDIAMAIEDLIRSVHSEGINTDNEVLKNASETLFGSWSKRDEFGQKILSEIEFLRSGVRAAAIFSENN